MNQYEHNQMPAVLTPDEEERWPADDGDDLAGLLNPYSTEDERVSRLKVGQRPLKRLPGGHH